MRPLLNGIVSHVARQTVERELERMSSEYEVKLRKVTEENQRLEEKIASLLRNFKEAVEKQAWLLSGKKR
jgi:hypothetical protein